jgi:predicted nuclease of predicted toxin-antitoxin system
LKLLLDENHSARLLPRLADHFLGSTHVTHQGLQGASDASVWRTARDGGFVLISKDDDFRSLALVRGAPPKVVILRIGNASTDQIAERLLDAQLQIEAFAVDSAATVLII